VLAAVKSLRWPETGDEYEIIGGFRGEPVELVESETIPGLMVPAHAEWVIEGEFVSEDYRTPVNSEDLLLGFVWGEALWPLFRVKCITHRKDPLWTAATFSSLGHQDHQGVHSGLLIAVNTDAISMLRKMGYKVKDVVTVAQWVIIVQLEVDGRDKPHPGYGEEVGRAVGAKYTIVVGPDIDPYNLEEVLWAVGMRAGRSEWRDYPSPPPGVPPIPRYGIFNQVTTDMGFLVIDATIPVPERFDTFAPRTEPPVWENEAIERMKKKIGRA
jgi:UbiD family decarboxylase